MWRVYLFKKKYEAFQTLTNFHAWIENEAQSHIRTLHTNNGKEYTSNHFEFYLFQHGIAHKTIVSYNPQKHGFLESMNRTIMNILRSMLFFKNVKLMILGDALLCAVYFRKWSPNHVLENKALHELWYGFIPSVRHLGFFGSICYALISKEQRDKIGARGSKCIFLGYLDTYLEKV